MVFLCLDNLGQDFQVIIVALVGDLQGNNFGIPFYCLCEQLVDQPRELACLDADGVEVHIEELLPSLGVLGDFPVCIVQFCY